MSFRDNKATLYDIEHSSVLNAIGVLLSTTFGEVCSSDRTMGPVLQACKRFCQQTFVTERHGDWYIHVCNVRLMIPYLHCALYIYYMHDQLKCTCKRRSTWQKSLHLINTKSSRVVSSSQSDTYRCDIWTDSTTEWYSWSSRKQPADLLEPLLFSMLTRANLAKVATMSTGRHS